MPDDDLGRVFHALADPSRRRVVATLAADPTDGERPCGSFDLPVAKATRTHHFRVLREAGLVEQRPHGNGSSVRLARGWIDEHWPGLLDLVLAEAEAEAESDTGTGAANADTTPEPR